MRPTTPEQFAEAFANNVADVIGSALAKNVGSDDGLKKQMADELVKRTRSLAYSVALREAVSPERAEQDEVAIKEIGKWLVQVKGSRGRPTKRADIFIKAFELFNAGNRTWMQVTDATCDCGKNRHDKWCRKAINNGATRLLAVLRKYEIGKVSPLDQTKSEKIKRGIQEEQA